MAQVKPKIEPFENQYGHDVSDAIPAGLSDGAPLPPAHRDIWELARGHLRVRNNDGHTLYAYGLAAALVELHPDADPDIVLPAILLHDTGWGQIPPDEVLAAIAPGSDRPDLVLRHEKEGAAIAHDILEQLDHPKAAIGRICEIIDGHDSRAEPLSLDDALVKDADKLWRITPHGVDTVMDWFGLPRHQAHALIASRVHAHLFTDSARTMARGMSALARIDSAPQRLALEG